jgi:hypothetical protein
MACHAMLLSYTRFLGASKVELYRFVLLIVDEVLNCILERLTISKYVLHIGLNW